MSDTSARHYLYDARWQAYRLSYLQQHPLCVMCQQLGHVTASCVVDHKVPHRGDLELFWDEANHQAVCEHCHNAHKQAQERSGYLRGAGTDGHPIDPAHPWNTGGRSKVRKL